MIKKRSETAVAHIVSDADANKIADLIADKPYGKQNEISVKDEQKAQNISVSLPPSIIEKLQDTALANKRSGSEHRTVSALIKAALEQAGY